MPPILRVVFITVLSASFIFALRKASLVIVAGDRPAPLTIRTGDDVPALKNQPSQTNKFSVTRITFQPWGFEPRQTTSPKGPLLLALENRSGILEPKFQLFREVGQVKLKDIQMKKGDNRQRRGTHKLYQETFNLPPGKYLLVSVDVPQWVCSIEVEN